MCSIIRVCVCVPEEQTSDQVILRLEVKLIMSQNNSAQPAGIQKGRKRSQHIEYSIFKHLNSAACVTSNLVYHYCCCLILLIRIDPVSCKTSASLTEEKFPDIKPDLCPPETFSQGLHNISITKPLLCKRLCLFTRGKKKKTKTLNCVIAPLHGLIFVLGFLFFFLSFT